MTTLVLIPGLMNDADIWAAQLGPLSRTLPVLVACNDRLDSLGAMAARILDATGGPIVAAGHSMGGRVALELAARAPERIAGLALLGTGAHGPVADEAVARMRLVRMAEDEGMAAVAGVWLPPMMAPDADRLVQARMLDMLGRCPPAVFAAQQRALIDRPDRTALLPAIACPTLVATGALDGWSPPAHAVAMAEAIPDAELAIVDGAGHMLPVEAADAVTGLLARLVARCG